MTGQAAEFSNVPPLSRQHMDMLARDPDQPEAVRHAAREALAALSERELRAALDDFHRATPIFLDFAKRLTVIAEATHEEQHGDAAAALARTISDLSSAYAAIGDMISRPLQEAEMLVETAAAHSALTPGRVIRSTLYVDLAAEYRAMFDDAEPEPDAAELCARFCQRLVGHRDVYETLQSDTGAPWEFIGLLHGLESGFRFDRPLLAGQTGPGQSPERYDTGRACGWMVSATDCLRGRGFHLIDDWSLSRKLYEMEAISGFEHRSQGLVSPYLWAGSNMCRAADRGTLMSRASGAAFGRVGAAIALKGL